MSSSSSSSSFPVTALLTSKLNEAFSPTHLQVINESSMHNVPPESESHFKVVVVSDKFREAKTPLARHRMVNTALADEIGPDGVVHALSIVAKTPAQWQKMVDSGAAENLPPTPNCRGGDGSLPPRNAV